MTTIYIIRFGDNIEFPSGKKTCLMSKMGTYEEVMKYAKEIAEKYHTTVEAVK